MKLLFSDYMNLLSAVVISGLGVFVVYAGIKIMQQLEEIKVLLKKGKKGAK